jgi:cardiolipin synthase
LKRIHRLVTTFLALCIALVFYSFESHAPSSIALKGQESKFFYTPCEISLQDTLIECMRNAKSSISMAIYSLRDRKIIQTLNDKAKQGVKVNVVCDASASGGVEKLLHKKIKLTCRSGTGLMHDKWIIVDKENLWIGSANMTRDSMSKHFNLMEQMNSPEVAAYVSKKIDQLTQGKYEKPLDPLHFTIKGKRSSLHFLPDDTNACGTIKGLIEGAKKTIRVAMYTFTRKDLAESLVAAKKRGVKVEVALYMSTSKNASKKIDELLKIAKVKLHYNSGNELLHHKFVWIDDRIVAHGSANWTIAAFKQNDDCIMIHYDLTEAQKSVLDKAWRNIVAQSP